jgi:hypothetical protein
LIGTCAAMALSSLATGAMNFLVFVMSALVSPALGWWLHKLAGGGPITLDHFVTL